MTKLHELFACGQSIWYDNISRDLLQDGGIQRLIDQGVRGITSNPTIFDNAISKSDTYDADLQAHAGIPTFDLYETLVMDDIRAACDLLRPVYDESQGGDGYVSIEVSPTLARDTQGTIDAARRYFQTLARPNLMVKIPATPEGIPAIEQCIRDGININATLMFSLDDYEAVAEAYLKGLESRLADGADISGIASVASFFVSRVDTKTDAALEAIGNTELQGQIAIANAKVAYARFKEVFSGPRWEALAAKGARVQRPLWASTGTKNPAYSDVLYVDNLIGPHTVNTVPTATLDAFMDHGVVEATVETGLEAARQQIAALAGLGINFGQITAELQEEGVDKFAASFQHLLQSIEDKVKAVAG